MALFSFKQYDDYTCTDCFIKDKRLRQTDLEKRQLEYKIDSQTLEIKQLQEDVEILLDVVLYKKTLTAKQKEHFATRYKEHILENVAKDVFK